MQHAQGALGRVFVLRLEDKDRLPDAIEDFAMQQGVARAACLFFGGIGGGRLVVGPRDSQAMPPDPMLLAVEGAHEAAAMGSLFPDEEGRPRLHMHACLGRGEDARTGCVRPGVDVWLVGECLLFEITECTALRRKNPESGFTLLEVK